LPNESGDNGFVLASKQWIERTNAKQFATSGGASRPTLCAE